MEVLALLAVLWRRRLVVFASVVTLLLAATAASLLLPESYEATCEVVVAGEESASSLLNDLGLPELAISLTNTDTAGVVIFGLIMGAFETPSAANEHSTRALLARSSPPI